MLKASKSSALTDSISGGRSKYPRTIGLVASSTVSVPSALASINPYSTASRAGGSMMASTTYQTCIADLSVIQRREELPIADAHVIEDVLLVAPVCFNLDEQFEMAAMAEQFLDVVPRAHADLLQTLGAVTNDDLLLGFTFDEDRAVDAREVCARLFP